jgi:hypothetical protein
MRSGLIQPAETLRSRFRAAERGVCRRHVANVSPKPLAALEKPSEFRVHDFGPEMQKSPILRGFLHRFARLPSGLSVFSATAPRFPCSAPGRQVSRETTI